MSLLKARVRRPIVWPARIGASLALFVACCVFALAQETPAFGDATAPPLFPASCPGPQNPPAGYPLTGKPIPYEVPFKGIIGQTESDPKNKKKKLNYGGSIDLPPYVKIPALYASVCGLIELPQLSGTITSSDIELATPNIYVAGIEALPISVKFGQLDATINLKPAANGGLDITLQGDTTASVTTLGMTCGITLNAKFTTLTDGKLSGEPVTGPTMAGQAEVVSNSFPVPAVVGSNTGKCPPSIAQTFNKLLGLPEASGVGMFVAPFCFDFELEGTNNPNAAPTPNPDCPWPKS